LITPSGQNYATLTPEMLVKLNLEGDWEGDYVPSSEWRFHVNILKNRPDINAVVHTHSMFATIQSMTRQAIPACHYLIAQLGGNDVRCAPYARFGSQELSDYAVAALEARMACLLSNHGAIAIGRNLQQAVDNAVLLETLSQQYHYAKIAGVCLLTDQEITETQQALAQLPTYGQR
jgi:L-fuculose-phosphate aldolase